MLYHDDQQDVSPELGTPREPAKRRNGGFSFFKKPINAKSPRLPGNVFWAVILTGPLLLCAIVFLTVMASIYNTQIATRLPTDELALYIGEMCVVGTIILVSVILCLFGIFKKELRRIFYGSGVVLFIILMVVFESFISSSTQIYAIQPHLEITRTSFSPTQMDISTDDKLQISNASDGVAETLSVSSATNTGGIPAQLLRPGLTLQPGQSINVVFSNEGTFTLSRSTVPGLTLAITVIETGSSGQFNDFSQ